MWHHLPLTYVHVKFSIQQGPCAPNESTLLTAWMSRGEECMAGQRWPSFAESQPHPGPLTHSGILFTLRMTAPHSLCPLRFDPREWLQVKALLTRKTFLKITFERIWLHPHLDRSPLELQLGDAGMRGGRGELLVFKLALDTGQASRQWTSLCFIHHLRADKRPRDIWPRSIILLALNV